MMFFFWSQNDSTELNPPRPTYARRARTEKARAGRLYHRNVAKSTPDFFCAIYLPIGRRPRLREVFLTRVVVRTMHL